MKKILFFLILIITFFLIYFFISSNIGTQKNKYINIIDDLLSQKTKNFLKETIFVFKYQKVLKKEISDRDKIIAHKAEIIINNEKKIKDLENNIIEDKNLQIVKKKNVTVETDLKELKIQIIDLVNDDSLVFELTDESLIEDSNFKIKKYTNPNLRLTGPRAYFASFKDNLLLMTGSGTIMYASFDELEFDNFILKRIPSNFRDFVDREYIYEKQSIVVSIFSNKNKIYVSYIKKLNDECYMNSVLVSEFNFNKLNFEEFFATNECTPSYENTVGGNIVNYKNNKILIVIGDWHSYEKYKIKKPQNLDSLIGKIISVDKNTKDFEILSMGHRNPQGLFYDVINDVIFISEHGPQGGDEINININPNSNNIKNYGWAISSYGEHYGFPDKKKEDLYELAPLNKSHKNFGFIEPTKYFTPSIAPSQIIKTEEFSNKKEKHVLYLGAMGNDILEGDLSLHQIILDANYLFNKHYVIPIGDRVRDIKYIRDMNKIFLYLETSGSIGILESISN